MGCPTSEMARHTTKLSLAFNDFRFQMERAITNPLRTMARISEKGREKRRNVHKRLKQFANVI